MAGFNYGRMQGTATRLLDRFKQGTILLVRPGTSTPGPNPWDPPVETPPATFTMSGVAKGVSHQFINGTTILATDIEVTLSTRAVDEAGAEVAIEPDFARDTLTIDGKAVSLVRDLSIPAAGVRVALRYIVRA